MRAERARERTPLLRLDHQHIGVAELVALVPERHGLPTGGAEVEHGHDGNAGDAERHHGRRMVMAHRRHIETRLIDAAVDHPLGIELDGRRHDRLGI